MGRCIIRTSKIGYFNSTTIVSSKEKVSDYLKENIYYSISGYTYAPPFMQMYEQVGADHILYSSDYPYVSMKDTLDFVDQLDISEEDKDKILYKNAQQLFNL